jgi:hypothetical protein
VRLRGSRLLGPALTAGSLGGAGLGAP